MISNAVIGEVWIGWRETKGPFAFYRPDEQSDSYWLFWGRREIIVSPIKRREVGRVAT